MTRHQNSLEAPAASDRKASLSIEVKWPEEDPPLSAHARLVLELDGGPTVVGPWIPFKPEVAQ